MRDRIRLVVVFGGRSAEHDVSCISARHVLAAADPARYVVEPIAITQQGQWVRAEEAARALERGADALPEHLSASGPPVDLLPELAAHDSETVVVFPVLHGPMGEDGTIQGLLELADVAYVGSGVLGSALCMDKIKAKEIAAQYGIAQPAWRAVHGDDRTEGTAAALAYDLGLPVFVKPANLGSSVGVTRADTVDQIDHALDTALAYDEWVIAEEAITGREIEVAVLGNNRPRASVPGEIVPAADFYTYEDKYLDGAAELLVPAPLPEPVAEEVRALAVRAFRALRCKGLARIDFFYEPDGRGVLLNEANTMPGFTPISMYPQLWRATGLSYAKLIDELVALALERRAGADRHRRVER